MSDKLLSQLLKGTYDNASSYSIGDIVDYNGSSYACKANTTGNLPTNTTYWAMLAEKGDKGDTGDTGATGATGPAGVGITWQGDWSAGTYQINDGVAHNGSSWVATAITTEEPSESATDWDLIAQKGADGSGGISDGDKGDITVTASGATWTIDNSAVTFAKVQNIATNRMLGRSTAGNGVVEELTATQSRDNIGLGTSDSPQFTGVNIGHATDTTLGRTSAGVLNVEGVVIPTISSTNTLTNKRIQPRSSTSASGDITPDLATANIWQRTAQSAALAINAPTGTPVLGEVLVFMITDNGTARAITWNAAFTTKVMGSALPTTTTISKQLLVTCQYDGSTWLCLSSQQT